MALAPTGGDGLRSTGGICRVSTVGRFTNYGADSDGEQRDRVMIFWMRVGESGYRRDLGLISFAREHSVEYGAVGAVSS